MIRISSPYARTLAAVPVVSTPLLVEWFVRTLPQNAWDWTDVLVTLFSLAQLPSLLVALAWALGWPHAPWGNAALIVVALMGGAFGWLSPVVWPTVLINLPGLLVALFTRRG